MNLNLGLGLLMLLSFCGVSSGEDPFRGQPVRNMGDADRVLKRMSNLGPKVGEDAPDALVFPASGANPVQLSTLWKEEKPVVLIFGSLTCDLTCRYAPQVKLLHERFKEQANFAYIYIREAHPSDGWVVNPTYSVISEPISLAERVQAAGKFANIANHPFPSYVDQITDELATLYGAWPNRIYVVLPTGKIGYASAIGPWGYRPSRNTPVIDPDSIRPFGPGLHERPIAETFLERYLRVDVTAHDSFAGKKVNGPDMALSMIFTRTENAPQIGEPVSNLKLENADGSGLVDLSDFWKEKPAVITFGSLTEQGTMTTAESFHSLEAKFGKAVQFLRIYVRECCPADGWPDPKFPNVVNANTLSERIAKAQILKTKLRVTTPILVDSMSDEAAVRFSAWPCRTIVVDREGRLRYRGYQGPWRYKPVDDFTPPAHTFHHFRVSRLEDVESVDAFLQKFTAP